MKAKPLIYLAGGFYTGWQDRVKECLAGLAEFYDPRDANQNCLADLSIAHREKAKVCDYMLAYFEKDNPSGLGLAKEIGMAVAVGKARIFFVDEHPRINGFLAALSTYIFSDLGAALERLEKELQGKTWISLDKRKTWA